MKKTAVILFVFFNIFINSAYGKNLNYIIKPNILNVFDGDTILIETKAELFLLFFEV